MEDTLAFYGGAVKALGGGKVGGYLVLFSGPDKPDLQGEFFTKSTDFSLENGESRPIYYRHGSHPLIKSRIGKAVLTVDDVGVFVEGELDLRNKYIRALYSKAEEKKDEPFLGWSSGSMTHLVEMKPVGTVKEIVAWPIGEASLTPVPVEPRTIATTLKDLSGDQDLDLEAMVKSLEEPEVKFDIAGTPALKAFCEIVAPNSLLEGSQRSESAALAGKEFITIARIYGEATQSYTARLVRRSEHRFLKDKKAIDASTVTQVKELLADMEQLETAFENVKEILTGIKKIADLSAAEQKGMNEKAKYALWNYYRISGFQPKELDDAGNSTS